MVQSPWKGRLAVSVRNYKRPAILLLRIFLIDTCAHVGSEGRDEYTRVFTAAGFLIEKVKKL